MVELANEVGIRKTSDLSQVRFDEVSKLFTAVARNYGENRAAELFQGPQGREPLVVHLDTFQQRDAADYAVLHACRGRLLFGIPHVVMTYYVFDRDGTVEGHEHAGGVEFLYSLEGGFTVGCGRSTYALSDDGSVLLVHARRRHSIALAGGNRGRLAVVRFDPRRRHLSPGPTLRERRARAHRRMKGTQG